MTLTLETTNRLTNARIVGPSNGGDYVKSDVRRGDPAFVMSRSALKDFALCPSRWIRGYKEDDTASTEWGDMLDCLICTPEDFNNRFIVAPSTYPGAKGEEKPWSWNANYCKDWRDKQEDGVTVIKHDESAALLSAKAELLKDAKIRLLIECSEKQILIEAEYQDKETGIVVPLKGLVDLAPDKDNAEFGNCLADLKTCNSAHPRAWAKQVNEYGYDMQGALYLDMWTAATGEDRNTFRHALQESFPPYQTGRRILAQEFVEVGRLKYQSALKCYAQCLADNYWPDYETGRDCIDGWTITQPEAWMVGP